MKVIIENMQSGFAVDDNIYSLIQNAVDVSFASEGFDISSEVSILLVDDERIREINKEQRNVDKATDVLSFPMVEMADGEIISDEGDFDLDEDLLLLGDIVISVDTAVRQSKEYGHSFEREIAFLVTHGVFHLLGYDHEEKDQEQCMMNKQETVLEKIGLGRSGN